MFFFIFQDISVNDLHHSDFTKAIKLLVIQWKADLRENYFSNIFIQLF